MTGYWDPIDIGDERIAAGFDRMRARRDADLADGARHAGWKVGMNDGGIREMLGIRSGVVGYLTDRTRSNATVVPGTGRLGAEVEVLFEIGADGSLTRAAAAIEVVDLHELDVSDALARDVWHLAYLTGPFVDWDPSMLPALRVELRHGDAVVDVAPPGDDRLRDLDGMRAFAALGASIVGPGLQPGDLVLSGSLAPSILWLAPGDVVEATVHPLGSVSVRVS